MNPRNRVLGEVQITQGEGEIFGVSGPLKIIVSNCCVYAVKDINNGISATAATDCMLPTGRCQ